MILVDFREKQSKVPQLLQDFKLPIQTDDLLVDYIIDGECFVERKTISDFITSVVDGRLFKQVEYLARNCASPLLLLEGGGLYNQGRMNANAIRGVLLWVTMKKKVPILHTYNEYDTACMLSLLTTQFEGIEHMHQKSPPRNRKTISLRQQEINVLTQIPGIGRQTAKDLLAVCGSLANMVETEDAELINLPRIGKERLSAIRRLFPKQVKINQL
jgi:ERCC4-type nuclease